MAMRVRGLAMLLALLFVIGTVTVGAQELPRLPIESYIEVEYIPDDQSGFTTQDASGCNINVCIYLYGTGLIVNKWVTTAYVSKAQCSYARFWVNGSLRATSGTGCTSGSGTLRATWHNPGWFPNNSQLCNSWNGISGYPCKTVKL